MSNAYGIRILLGISCLQLCRLTYITGMVRVASFPLVFAFLMVSCDRTHSKQHLCHH
jgi:hypothetical protein